MDCFFPVKIHQDKIKSDNKVILQFFTASAHLYYQSRTQSLMPLKALIQRRLDDGEEVDFQKDEQTALRTSIVCVVLALIVLILYKYNEDRKAHQLSENAKTILDMEDDSDDDVISEASPYGSHPAALSPSPQSWTNTNMELVKQQNPSQNFNEYMDMEARI